MSDIFQSGELQSITIAFLILAWFFVSLRVWTRTFIISNFGWDDGTMVLSCLIFTVFCAALLAAQTHQSDRPITTLDEWKVVVKYFIVGEASYIMTFMILKISLGIFFARIVVKRWHFTLIYVTLGINILSSITTFFFSIFRCGTDLDMYLLNHLTGHCAPIPLDRFMAYQQAVFNTLTDLMLLILPVVILWDAHMDRKAKLSVGFILCLAVMGCICSMIRFRFIEGLITYTNFFWSVVNICMWSTIEAGTCIIAGCLATLRPLVKCAIHRARESPALSGAAKRISRSFGSGGTSRRSTNSSQPRHSQPPFNTLVDSKFTPSERLGSSSTSTKKSRFHESIAQPGNDVIPLSSDIGNRRTSTDPILGLSTPDTASFPWNAEPKESWHKDDRKRQTIPNTWSLQRDDSWSTRGDTASDTRISGRPTSEPLSLGLDWKAGQAV